MSTQVHEFTVTMNCGGCSSAVEKVVGKIAGVEKVETSVEKQKVWVTAKVPAETILEAIKKAGKKAEYVGVKK